ncbi:MAG TPA: bifunctional 4-hydroxy-2-oxoglutarate aldolase/2-dehydro-3-deoxy-phosphogluconate aldolase [Phycisphaerae bacterium]|jgi:Entner-Doudoroff aldolase
MHEYSRESIVEEIQRRRISAIIRSDDENVAADAMRAAIGGGFRMVEFTLTTPGALRLIGEFARDPQLLVGAGTVLTVDQARRAIAAGARFVVSPICDPQIIAAAHELGAVSIPGTFTPTEMMHAHRLGADFVKLFPAPANVADYVRAVLGPLPQLRIFPTAGVTLDSFVEVLRAGAAGVGFVRSLFDPEDLARRDFKSIERRAAQIVERLRSIPQASGG